MNRREFLAALLSVGGVVNPPGDVMRPIFPQRLTPQLPTLIRKPPPEARPQIYNSPSPSTPLHLSASVLLNSGGSASVNPTALKNPMGQDMEILEVKFELSSDFVGGDPVALGGTIFAELALGQLGLTNAAVPCWGFGRAENLAGESKTDLDQDRCYLAYSWRLPRPLFVPADQTVVPKFSHRGDIPNSVNVRIGYSCRTVKTKPRVVYVPWVARYISTAYPLATAFAESSNELDLVNPHKEVLHLQRFTGRALATLVTSATVQPNSERQPFAFGAKYTQLRMTDSYGRPLIRTFTPFRSAFAAGSRSWELDNGTTLDPLAHYRVDLKHDAMTLSAGYAGTFGQAQVSMVGWREVPL